ncbi:MAG: cysteine desulfurase NifS [Candidatus Solincola sediminis]|uniref:Cysteine desulfurase NifS n=1 Tax=Candidatus Solincola sediminis TaxID=1797199 RepID=A0A1F2WQX1_9ACTN|nr:MAG: cysteine desulfurase NifS [Candidatus Solincola sediminis]OFW59233.1 MAG: cysteine desulfurase NifS [Candidatus Solincola sediminis]
MRAVYLDHYAASPLPEEVQESMLPFLAGSFGNPSSLHRWGDDAKTAVEESREKVAALIGANPEEIIFTSNGTEANNLAIKGMIAGSRRKGKHIVISGIEHFSVMNPAKSLEKQGYDLVTVPADEYGVVDLDELAAALDDETALLSIMTANGEIGTIQPIREIAAIAMEKGVPFHTDAIAAAGHIPIDIAALGVQAMSIASDGMYGPKGAGALWIKKGIRLIPLLDGGVQEGGRRGGTENVAAIVGMGTAAQLARERMGERSEYLRGLRDALIVGLPDRLEHINLTGHLKQRLPWNASFVVEFIEGEGMLLFLDAQGVAVSSGSACTSRALKGSHVLAACGIPPERAQGSILFSFGPENNMEDVEYVLDVFPPIVERLRQMSPLYAKFMKERG